MWANGATGLLNANSLNSLKTAISGLSKEQALLVLSTKNLSKAQTEQVLSAAGLLNVEKQLTTAQMSERLAKELNSKADAEALLINSGLITQKELEENAIIKVTAAKINEAVANGTLSASDAGVIAGALGITGVNTGATISFDLLTASIWANIKALGAWLVTNPIGWAILGGTAIFGLVKAYDALTDSVEEVKERTDALLETYNSAISEANSNAQTIESLASRYEKLSKGVNNLGENVSLTADEYSEYNDIVNQIADMFPTMITGYTDEGNAILSLKGNVEELRDAYKEAQKEAYNLLIVSGKDSDGNDIITNYQNQVYGNETWLSKTSSYIDGEAGAKDAIEIITRLTGALTPDEFRETYNQLYEEYKNIWNSDKIQDALKSSGFEELTHAPKWSEITVEDLANVRYSAQATIQTYNAEINSQLKNIQTLANAYLMTNSDYEKLDEQSKTAVSLLVNSINENIANEFSSKEDVGAYVGNLVTSISDNDEVQNALKNLFTMDSSDMSVSEVKNDIDSYINTIAAAIGENPTELKIRLGFDDSDTQSLINNVKEKLQDEFDDRVGELKLDELQIAAEQIKVSDGTLLSWDELIAKIKEVQSSTLNNKMEVSTFEDAWADSFTSENDKVKELGDTLLGLAEKGRLTKEVFEESDSTAGDYFKNLGISADEAVAKINKLVDESKQLSSMASQISSISDALSTKLEDGFVSADTLSGFDVEVRGLDSWDKFQEVLGSTTSLYEECQEAANALATEWVNSSDFLAQLTEQNKEYYETQLKAMGIENYEEIIEHAQALNEAKEVLTQSSLMLGDATQDEIEALIAEGQYSELTANMILALYDAKIAEQAATIDTSADCANLIALAGDTDRTSKSIELLIQLMNIYSELESGVYDNNAIARAGALGTVNGIKAQLESIANGETTKMEIEPTVKLGNRGKSSAKSAGKEAGKSLKDGLKEELSDLEGIISSLSRAIDGQKEVISSQKEVALEVIESQISALEEERDARLEAIEAEKKALQDRIKAIDKQIDVKQKEIDAINDAAKARQHEIDLQKAQYELERMQNQRVILQYSEDKGMHYVADESGVRDAREKVDDAKRQLAIDAIEKEIDLLEDQKDLLNEQIDLLDEQAESIKNFYDAQIKSLEKQKESTEKYFESLMKSIEGSKNKYQELLDIVDKAELSGKLKKLGIDEEALLNGSEEEFEKLKNAYLDVVFQVNEGNEEMLSSLRELSGYEGTAPTVLTDTAEKLDEVNEQLDTSTESMDKLSDSATNASEGTSAIATSMKELSTNTEGVSDNLTSINDALTGLPEAEKITAISEAFTNMSEAIKSVADALGVGEDGTVGGLVGVLQSLSEISLGEIGGDDQGGGTGIVSQFHALKTAVDDVTNAISGSGGSGGGDASNSSSQSMSSGASGGGGEGASGLVGAIESFKSATDKALGSGGEEGSGSDGKGSGVIGQFGQLKKAVDDVTTAIGSGDSEGSEGGSGEEDAASLIGVINQLGETTEEILAGGGESDGESGGVIGRFEEFKDVIGEANEHVTGISEGLAAIDGQEVECTIRVNIETTGGLPAGLAHATGTALDTMKLESADYNAKYLGNTHVEGTALASGNWAVQSDEKDALVGEVGYEIVVRNGRFFTVGNNGAERFPIKKGDIVFNHEQSVELLKNGHISGRGRAYADGTVGNPLASGKFRPIQPGDRAWELQEKFKPILEKMNGNLDYLAHNAVIEHKKQMEKMVNQLNAGNVVNNIANSKPSVNIGDIHVTCPGVTSQQVAEQLGGVLGKELDRQFSGFYNWTDQMSRIR